MNPKKLMEKLLEILNAWKELAPDEKFADMTLAEFEAEILKSVIVRQVITDLENQMTNKTQERDTTDAANWGTAQLVVSSVVGNKKFGKNSGLYESMGYVTTDQRKSGLTRKKRTNGSENNED